MADIEKKYDTMEEFWPFYLTEHRSSVNKGLHFVGSAGALYWLGQYMMKKKPSFLLYGVLMGYGFAWIGHFFVEKNKPASFKYPFKSFICDWLMFYSIISGRINEEVRKSEEIAEKTLALQEK